MKEKELRENINIRLIECQEKLKEALHSLDSTEISYRYSEFCMLLRISGNYSLLSKVRREAERNIKGIALPSVKNLDDLKSIWLALWGIYLTKDPRKSKDYLCRYHAVCAADALSKRSRDKATTSLFFLQGLLKQMGKYDLARRVEDKILRLYSSSSENYSDRLC